MTFAHLSRSLFAVALVSVSSAYADAQRDKQQMHSQLDLVQGVFEGAYAPANWKNQHFSWDLRSEIQKAKDKIDELENPTTKQFQKILKGFFDSTRDYHVGVQFYSTEMSSLPFTVRGAEGRYFISWIDRSALPLISFPFNVGDEIVTFGDLPTGQVVAELQKDSGFNVPGTDSALAELALTRRRAARAQAVPKGTLFVGIKPKGSEEVIKRQLVWTYEPETISDPRGRNAIRNRTFKDLFDKKMQFADFESFKSSPKVANPHALGGRQSFIPDLGEKTWESAASDTFYAYSFKDSSGRNIGYVRIASYGGDEPEALAFAEVMKRFATSTDALVIDQVNNPGGSVFYLYALASMLSDQPMVTPRHRMTIDQSTIVGVQQLLPFLLQVQTDEEAQVLMSMLLGSSTLGGYPVSLQTVRLMVEYCRFIESEWNSKRTLTEPFYIWGIDALNPHPTVQYKKPILLLTNELDFSGGDFFPAILQDNKRVKIMGTRTAGAGGYVHSHSYPNNFGVEAFRYTASLAERVDRNPIENLGVTPDVGLTLTANDLQNNFVDYKANVLKQLSSMIP